MIHQGMLVFDSHSHPPLISTRVAGLALLERGIRTMRRAGVDQVLVVTPEAVCPKLRRRLGGLDLQLEFATRGGPPPSWAPEGDFLLLRGDHVHHHSSLSSLMGAGLRGADFVAQVSQIPSQGQACGGGATAGGGPGQQASSGAFLCSRQLFTPAELIAEETELGAFLAARIEGRHRAAAEVSPHLWQLVSDCRSARAAGDMLFAQVSKATTGFVARALNVRISVPLSRLLIDTGITSNMVTIGLVLSTGLLGAWLASQPASYVRLALAGLFWQLSSVVDGCDGEIARVKLCESRLGAWVDTLADNISYACGYAGMVLGMHRLHPDALLPLWAAGSAALALCLTMALLYLHALKTGTGSLQYFQGDLARRVPENARNWAHQLVEYCGFVGKRDFYSLFIGLALIAGQFEFAYWFMLLLVHLAALTVAVAQYWPSRVLRAEGQGGLPCFAAEMLPPALPRGPGR